MSGVVDWANFVQKIYEAMDRKVNAMLYQAVMAAGDKVLPADRFTLNIQITDAEKENIIQLVDDIKALTGEDVAIMGTKVALSRLTKLTPAEWISNEMKNERHTIGRLGIWEGTTLAEIPQTFEPNSVTNRMVDNNKLLIMPVGDNKFIKMFDEGEAQMSEITDGNTNVDKTIEYEYQQKMGVATIIGKKFGQIKIKNA